jgi:hypothetical protein
MYFDYLLLNPPIGVVGVMHLFFYHYVAWDVIIFKR